MRARAAACSLAIALSACAGSRRAPAPEPPAPRHRVEAGETLYGIAERYGTDVGTLARLNGIDDPSRLTAGRMLRLPVQGSPAPVRPPMDRRAPDPIVSCRAHGPAPRIPETGWIWPVEGVVLTRFGQLEGQKHEGLAIGAPLGTPVWAAGSGRVLIAGEEPGYGRVVVVEHPDGWVTLYGSLERSCVAAETRVRRGQLIGLVGASSGVASPRLYFELRGPRGPVDPRPRLP